MKILLTGASGFLGKYIYTNLVSSHQVISLGRSRQNDLRIDLAQLEEIVLPEIDLVVHAAGKAHSIPKTEAERQEFFLINYHGTVKLLDALGKLETKPKLFVFISTVAVYGKDSGSLISENIKPVGKTPYAQSKILAEEAVWKWGQQHGVNILIFRLPLIAGKNPPGNLGSLIKAISKGYYFRIGNGTNKKSIVLADDVAKFIEPCNTKNISGIYNLTDGVNPSLTELDEYIGESCGKKIKVMPLWIIKFFARTGDLFSLSIFSTSKLEKLTGELTFDCTKAKTELDWMPLPAVKNFLEA